MKTIHFLWKLFQVVKNPFFYGRKKISASIFFEKMSTMVEIHFFGEKTSGWWNMTKLPQWWIAIHILVQNDNVGEFNSHVSIEVWKLDNINCLSFKFTLDNINSIFSVNTYLCRGISKTFLFILKNPVFFRLKTYDELFNFSEFISKGSIKENQRSKIHNYSKHFTIGEKRERESEWKRFYSHRHNVAVFWLWAW